MGDWSFLSVAGEDELSSAVFSEPEFESVSFLALAFATIEAYEILGGPLLSMAGEGGGDLEPSSWNINKVILSRFVEKCFFDFMKTK